MKSLILKDLYNIGHNARTMFLLLLVFVILLVPQIGVTGYITTSSILCSMMIITTFAFDDAAKWTKYAMIMPVTRKDVVLSKFIVLLIFTAIGAVSGMILGLVGGIVFHKFDIASIEDWITLPAAAGIGLVIAFFFGCIVIPLLFKFGAEKARILSIVAFVVPVAICLAVYHILTAVGITVNDAALSIIIWISPAFALIWAVLMYKVSCRIFDHQEF